MSEHGSTSSRLGRRALSVSAVLAIAATGAAWSGCGDDNDDEASSIIEQANSTANEALDQASSTANEAAEDAQDQVDEATDNANQAAEDAQNQADQATDDSQSQGGGYGN
jgi:arabinogalactan oligomer/maltooligosaccharide transport system substrate-binding protein